jgi:hypothetical protein
MSETDSTSTTKSRRRTKQENTSKKEPVEAKKMEVEIIRYKRLLEALEDPKKVAKMIAMIAVILVLVFMLITGVMLIVKHYYSYNSINSNKYGATIIKNEDTELIYWLFNSADLWANSGIEVKEGDVISIRTSGAFHTAIHHLTADAHNNVQLRDNWIFSNGDQPSISSPLEGRDRARSEFRIAKGVNENILLMQVIPSDIASNNDWKKGLDPKTFCYLDGRDYGRKKADIYVIGERNEDVRIRTDGILHFAVNDIVLTDRVIDEMMEDTNKLQLGITKIEKDTCTNELEYYKAQEFVDAWYADNVGSFLIVIERKNKKL